MQVQEYEKRLATAIRLLGEEAGRRYMEQRLRDLRGEIERKLIHEVLNRLADLTWHQPLLLAVIIGPQGVQVQLGRTQAAKRGGKRRGEIFGGFFKEPLEGSDEFA